VTTIRIRLTGTPFRPVVPEGAIDISRHGKWGNPHPVNNVCKHCGVSHDRPGAISNFTDDLYAGELRFSVDDVRRELADQTLACWCKPHEACHGDVYIQVIDDDIQTPEGIKINYPQQHRTG
jgi:Domain of unknown function (DUF4326)